MRAQTPQVFRRGALTQALEAAQAKGVQVTDEAQALELQGAFAVVVEGCESNLKITTPEDLRLAAFYLV